MIAYFSCSRCMLYLFTFQEHKILYKRHKFPCDITLGITFRTHKKIPVEFLDITFKKNKQKHYLLMISRNLPILIKCSFIDICVITIFKKSNFLVRSSHRRCSVKSDGLKNSANFTGKHLCCSLSLLK